MIMKKVWYRAEILCHGMPELHFHCSHHIYDMRYSILNLKSMVDSKYGSGLALSPLINLELGDPQKGI